jgi:phospholipid/cholesterol/gamma-HCH transport system substrate-binding protein
METRAHHLLIGAFMVIMVSGFFAFLIWLAKVDIDQEFVEYDIYFDESVAGLTKSSVVQYNGIPVGQVWAIGIDPNNPKRVLVKVEIESNMDIYEDSVAVLAMQGITGVAYVQIEGGSAGAAILKNDNDEIAPIINSRISPIQELFVGAPDFINQAIGVVGKLNELLNEDNRTSIGNILKNVDNVSQNFATGTEDIALVMAELNRAIQRVGDAAEAIKDITATQEGEDGVLTGLGGVLFGANKLLAQLNDLVYKNEGAVSTFTNGTLPEMSRLVVDARRLAIVLASLAENLENDPTGIIFTPNKPEYSPEQP